MGFFPYFLISIIIFIVERDVLTCPRNIELRGGIIFFKVLFHIIDSGFFPHDGNRKSCQNRQIKKINKQ